MLRKLTHTNEPVRLPLLADDSTVEAQFNAARLEVEKDLSQKNDQSFADEILTLIKATVGNSKALDAMKGIELAAVSMIEKNVRPKQIEKALGRLRETMKDHDTREALAYVRSQLSIQRYRESSDVHDLLDPSPDDVAFVTVRALSGDEKRAAERRAGHKPRQGALLAARAYDVMRREAREGGDGPTAYAEHVAKLTEPEQAELEAFEVWSLLVDREIARAGVLSIDGFDLKPVDSGYPVEDFLADCVEGDDVISEASRHIRNIATLGKLASLRPSLASGTDAQEDEETAPQTGGSAVNASTAEDPQQSPEN